MGPIILKLHRKSSPRWFGTFLHNNLLFMLHQYNSHFWAQVYFLDHGISKAISGYLWISGRGLFCLFYGTTHPRQKCCLGSGIHKMSASVTRTSTTVAYYMWWLGPWGPWSDQKGLRVPQDWGYSQRVLKQWDTDITSPRKIILRYYHNQSSLSGHLSNFSVCIFSKVIT